MKTYRSPYLFAVMPALILAVLCGSSCSSKKGNEVNFCAKVICSVGSVTVTGSTGTSKYGAPGCEIKAGDVLVSGVSSFAVIQIGDRGIVRIEEKTRLEISSMLADASIGLTLTQGKVASKVSRLSKDQSFTVRTPTSVAAVRGTDFAVETANGKDVVSVLGGKVAVASGKDADPAKAEIVIDAGKTGEIPQSGKISLRDIHRDESSSIEKVSSVEFVQDLWTVNGEKIERISKKIIEDETNAAIDDKKSKEERIQELIREKPKSLNEIKVVFGRLDEISLYSGKTLWGAVLERGSVYSILTTDGVIKVRADDIRQSSILR